jgi:hypothetical protein
MQKAIVWVAFMAIMCLLAAAAGWTASPAAKVQVVSIQGTVTEDEQLMDNAGQRYSVVLDAQGELLLGEVGRMVEVRGKLTEDSFGRKTLQVQAYKVLKN